MGIAPFSHWPTVAACTSRRFSPSGCSRTRISPDRLRDFTVRSRHTFGPNCGGLMAEGSLGMILSDRTASDARDPELRPLCRHRLFRSGNADFEPQGLAHLHGRSEGAAF